MKNNDIFKGICFRQAPVSYEEYAAHYSEYLRRSTTAQRDDIDERVRRFDKKLIEDYLVPIVVSIFTVIILMSILYLK